MLFRYRIIKLRIKKIDGYRIKTEIGKRENTKFPTSYQIRSGHYGSSTYHDTISSSWVDLADTMSPIDAAIEAAKHNRNSNLWITTVFIGGIAFAFTRNFGIGPNFN